jgi:hypothetical protein
MTLVWVSLALVLVLAALLTLAICRAKDVEEIEDGGTEEPRDHT